MTKEELEKENEELKKLVERLKEENKNWELRYRDLSQITMQPFDLSQITKQG